VAKRILIYTNHFFPENFKVNEVAHLLAEEGNLIHVITQTPNYPSGNFYKGYGIFKKSFERINSNLTVKRLPVIPRGSGSKFELVLNYLSFFLSTFFYTLHLAFFIKKYDVVFVHHTSPALITLCPILYKGIKSSKIILWDLDMWPDTLVALGLITNKRLELFLEKKMTWIYRQYNLILLGSKGFFHKANHRVGSAKVEYFPNWAEQVFHKNQPFSEIYEFPESQNFKLVYAGNLGEAQDLENVFKAIELLKNHPITWIFIGDGRFKANFYDLLISSNLLSKVVFLGNHPIEKMPYFFSKSDAMFLSLKKSDIFRLTVPAKLQAYMAAGKPVIGMLSGEGGEIIKESNCGFVSESGDFRGFAKNVLDLISLSEKEREVLGKNGKDFYNRIFSFGKRKDQLKRIVNI
jgi:glycosyltransferase involved in cell wall biosynthesis